MTSGRWRLNRLGRRFMWASLGVLATAVIMIVIAAQQMFINDQDLGFLLWIMIPAAIAAGLAAYLLSAPIARDAHRLSAAATRVADGDLTARTGVMRSDELGDAAVEFDRMVERLDAVEKERALMLSSISHDLRTPLAALRASVEALRDGVAEDPDASLSGMERQVEALAHLVDDLQLHTRLSAGTLRMRLGRVDVTELADEAIETVCAIARQHGVELALEADARVVVDGDGAQLGRVLRNLLDNAIRHTPAGTTVRIGVGHAADGVRLTVRDEGEGFPDELRLRAFDAFTRGDPARNVATGTAGLGLAIAREIVVAHGGAIRALDGPGGVVEVRLPATAAAA
ncbi:MAG: HAMP domain-containing sensor histidine kinase [Ilumatobacter sp.]|uniref:sensor histidine kinase n=1 Tax=Ilumatobacter sp. TaxID=1967498 RepID=UPI002619AE2D|nr:HAMP domain-containing sensor histidine kinase [Ilumatobacter sp.]MDJ0769062.1 HAMP domain-containing sensor histidine kinase [Ilumatobacter sp.]